MFFKKNCSIKKNWFECISTFVMHSEYIWKEPRPKQCAKNRLWFRKRIWIAASQWIQWKHRYAHHCWDRLNCYTILFPNQILILVHCIGFSTKGKYVFKQLCLNKRNVCFHMYVFSIKLKYGRILHKAITPLRVW